MPAIRGRKHAREPSPHADTVVTPPGWVKRGQELTDEQKQLLEDKLGAQEIEQNIDSADAEVASQGTES